MKKIACVVVTFNRKQLLINCLDAISNQRYKPHSVYIIDNASTDGTPELLEARGYKDNVINRIQYHYVALKENIGGAGGFYTGFKIAYESDELYDALWVMDDDGVPDENQLYELLPYVDTYGYVSSNVRDINDISNSAFCPPDKNCLQDSKGNYLGFATPFNGILYSRELIRTIGYPEKNMFIWGDEINYHARSVKAGYTSIMVSSALHFHPKDRQNKEITWFGHSIAIPKEDWKLYCYARNRVFNSRVINGYIKSWGRSFFDFIDFIIALYKLRQLSRLHIILTAQKDGRKGILTVSRKFL